MQNGPFPEFQQRDITTAVHIYDVYCLFQAKELIADPADGVIFKIQANCLLWDRTNDHPRHVPKYVFFATYCLTGKNNDDNSNTIMFHLSRRFEPCIRWPWKAKGHSFTWPPNSGWCLSVDASWPVECNERLLSSLSLLYKKLWVTTAHDFIVSWMTLSQRSWSKLHFGHHNWSGHDDHYPSSICRMSFLVWGDLFFSFDIFVTKLNMFLFRKLCDLTCTQSMHHAHSSWNRQTSAYLKFCPEFWGKVEVNPRREAYWYLGRPDWLLDRPNYPKEPCYCGWDSGHVPLPPTHFRSRNM